MTSLVGNLMFLLSSFPRRRESIVASVIILIGSQTAFAEDEDPILPEVYMSSSAGTQSEAPIWNWFEDPVLKELVERGISNNFDVESARYRIEQAEAVADQMLAPLLPSVSAEAGYNMMPYNSVGSGIEIDPIPGMPDTSSDETQVMHSISTVIKASYLIDITGRNYTARKASLQDAAATKADAETLAYNVAFLITQTYFDVVSSEIRLTLVEEQVKTNEELLELVEARLDMGSATALDVLQQRQQFEATRSQLPLVKALVATGKNQLALLAGYKSAKELPPIDPAISEVGEGPDLGAPENLLRARPDLRAESARVEASRQRKKSAFRTLLPSLMLTGQVGYQMNYIDLWDHGETWGVGALLTIPIWDGGFSRAGLKQSRAALEAARNTYNQKALNAVQEVESARVREEAQREHYQAVKRQLEASKVAFEEARERYIVGLTEYLNVLITLGTHQAAQLGEVQARSDLVLARVALLKALGGKWTNGIMRKSRRGE